MSRTLLAIAVSVYSIPACSQQWEIDSAHSAAQFAVRHMMVTTVRGRLGKLSGAVSYDPAKPSTAVIQAAVDVKGLDTREPKRDAHLRSADFFEAEKFPTIAFKSSKVEPAGPGKLKVTGDLTIKGITRPTVFHIKNLTAPVKDGAGERMGATATATINRKEFGILYNKLIETGGVVVGDEVQITIEAELVRRSPAK
jgi:polyisoprenoid-binding protein YceI